VSDNKHLPDVDRLSVVLALIMIAYAVTSFVSFPTQDINLQLPGFLLVVPLNIFSVIVAVVAILAAAGTDWLISTHPNLPRGRRWQHWLTPAFTAIAIGTPLNTLEVGAAWWVVFAFGGVLLASVFIAEYISVDSTDARFSFASLGLTAVSFALFLVLVTAIKGAGLRLYILLAAIIPTVFLISTRSLYLRLAGTWKLAWAAAITLIVTQLASSLFYLPLRPLQFGLILLGIFYGLISIATNLEEKRSSPSIWIEAGVMAAFFMLIGVFI